MEIYIEYAFLENFIFDGVLLWLALKAAKVTATKRRLFLSALLGGAFAVLFPLLRLSGFYSTILKLSFGLLLCLFLFPRLKTKKEWGRYALTAFFFFAFSFGFGGSLLGVYGFSFSENDEMQGGELSLRKIPHFAVFLGFVCLTLITIYFVRRVYARRQIMREVYDCRIFKGNRTIAAKGFLDSGNLAFNQGIPVCFLSPDLLYELCGDELLLGKAGGQVCDEMEITTVNGRSKIPLYRAELTVLGIGDEWRKSVYFAPSGNMIAREYKILLNARILEKQSGEGT